MTNAILRDVTIRYCRLLGLVLQGANLQQVVFQPPVPDQYTDLHNAVLHHATLVNVNLSRANLFGADLTAAYLSEVDFSGADLRQVLVGQTSEKHVKHDAATRWEPISVPDPSARSRRRRRTQGQRMSTTETSATSKNEVIVIPSDNRSWPLSEAREQVQIVLLERSGRAGRQGQPKFRADIFIAYQARCAISGGAVEGALEAAHIYPHCLTQNNKPCNGILLRGDLHELFDRDLLKVDPVTRRVALDPSIEDDYYHLAGKVIDPPPTFTAAERRDWIAALEWRRDEYYKLVEGFTPDSTATKHS